MADPVAVNVTVFLSLLTLGLALLMLAVAALSYARLRSPRLAAVAAGFALLAAKSGWTSWEAVTLREPRLVAAGLDALILLAFYLAVAKR